jgi:hypothetical protein
VTEPGAEAPPFSPRTTWGRRLETPLRQFVRTETGSAAISPNDRLQQLFHPWASYLIVPLFALANAGRTISGSFLAHAFTSPITLGIRALASGDAAEVCCGPGDRAGGGGCGEDAAACSSY